MPGRRYRAALVFIAALALQTIGCGSNSNSNRFLKSIDVTPATADGQLSPNGQVQFSATGTFTMPPSPEALTFSGPYTGGFTVDPSMATIVSSAPGTVTVRCAAGASGTTDVTAVACTYAKGTAATCVPVRGTAKLTCP